MIDLAPSRPREGAEGWAGGHHPSGKTKTVTHPRPLPDEGEAVKGKKR